MIILCAGLAGMVIGVVLGVVGVMTSMEGY